MASSAMLPECNYFIGTSCHHCKATINIECFPANYLMGPGHWRCRCGENHVLSSHPSPMDYPPHEKPDIGYSTFMISVFKNDNFRWYDFVYDHIEIFFKPEYHHIEKRFEGKIPDQLWVREYDKIKNIKDFLSKANILIPNRFTDEILSAYVRR